MTDVQWLLLLLSLLIIVPVIWSVTMGLLRKGILNVRSRGNVRNAKQKKT